MSLVLRVLCLCLSCGLVLSAAPRYSGRKNNCGGVYKGDSGAIVSPRYPSRYRTRRNCVFEISVFPGRKINLQFSNFHLQARRKGKCRDWLLVWDGNKQIGGPFCAKEIASSRVFTSQTSRMTVAFRSDRKRGFPGFKGTYSATGCGNPVIPRTPWTDSGNKIVGGNEAAPGSYPWQISLRRYHESIHTCGGALLAAQWVVTAAHCIEPGLNWVVAGEHDRSVSTDWKQTVKIERIFKHANYDDDTYENDIALLKLQSPVTLHDRVLPICLPDSTVQTPPGTVVAVAGWGTVAEGGRQASSVLLQADMPVEDDGYCVSVYNYLAQQYKYPTVDPKTMMCTGYRSGGVDTCQGDSGGPVVATSQGGTAYLAGIISWGFGCGRQYVPGVNTRVPAYVNWIRTTIDNNS